jgi:hypothetical protein
MTLTPAAQTARPILVRSGLRRLGQPIFSNAPQPVEVKPAALEGTSTVTRPRCEVHEVVVDNVPAGIGDLPVASEND